MFFNELYIYDFLFFFTLMASDSLLNSFTTKARASGFTPFSHRLTKIDNVFLSNPQFKICEISDKTK